MIIKEMKYTNKRHEPFILAKGQYKNHKYYVLSFGTYPTAYVSVEANVRDMAWEEIDKLYAECPIHCGISYAEKGLPHDELDESVKDVSFIGWDYGHIGDYVGDIDFSYKNTLKKWTTSEIVGECMKVIDKMEPNYTIKINKEPAVLRLSNSMTDFNFNIRYGWVCPLCGRVNSPDSSICPCNVNKSYETTTGTKPFTFSRIISYTHTKEDGYDVSFDTDGETATCN